MPFSARGCKEDFGMFNYAEKTETRIDEPIWFGIRPEPPKKKIDWNEVRILTYENKLTELPFEI